MQETSWLGATKELLLMVIIKLLPVFTYIGYCAVLLTLFPFIFRLFEMDCMEMPRPWELVMVFPLISVFTVPLLYNLTESKLVLSMVLLIMPLTEEF